MVEHGGTHMDAPVHVHLAKDGLNRNEDLRRIDDIPVGNLMGPGIYMHLGFMYSRYS